MARKTLFEEQQRELDEKLEQLSMLCQVSSFTGASALDALQSGDASDDWTESDSVYTVDETTTSDASSLPDFFAEGQLCLIVSSH